jgi:hypothetical protein
LFDLRYATGLLLLTAKVNNDFAKEFFTDFFHNFLSVKLVAGRVLSEVSHDLSHRFFFTDVLVVAVEIQSLFTLL